MANGRAGTTYNYADVAHPHAVTAVGANSYGYDANGNMTTRTSSGNSYTQSYDAENRLVGVTGAATASFVYGGDNNRVKGTVGGVTTVYVSNIYEVQGSRSRTHYTSHRLHDQIHLLTIQYYPDQQAGEFLRLYRKSRQTWGNLHSKMVSKLISLDIAQAA